MGHESQIEPLVATRPTFCFAGFGTDRLRCKQAMKTAGRENPNRLAAKLSNRANGAAGQNRSCSIKWAAKVENFRPREKCFFLTFPLQKLLHVCASVIWRPSLVAFFLRNSICCRRYLCS